MIISYIKFLKIEWAKIGFNIKKGRIRYLMSDFYQNSRFSENFSYFTTEYLIFTKLLIFYKKSLKGMIRKFTLLLTALFCTFHFANAQKCGFDVVHQQSMSQNPDYAQKTNQFNALWTNYLSLYSSNPNALLVNLSATDSVWEIPVVVHVIHTGGAVGSIYNPTDADIQDWINQANSVWEANWGSNPTPTTGGVKIPIKFVIAKRDSACNATTGILRVDGSSVTNYATDGVKVPGSAFVGGATEASIKALSRWNPTVYYNIYIVNRLDGMDGTTGSFTAGYAYLASSHGNSLDGAVMLATQVQSSNWPSGTLPHELGHAFNLYHVFEGGSTTVCPPLGPCGTTGDFCCDTEPIKQSPFNCPSDPNPCTSTSYNNTQKNYMDYSNCKDRFTAQQRARMILALKTTRGSFMTSLGATAPFTTSIVAAACTTSIKPANATNNFNIGPQDIILHNAADTVMHVKSLGYNLDGFKAYIDNTCRHMVTLKPGIPYGIRVFVNLTTTGSKTKAYIDYNNNGIFESNERILNAGSGSGYKVGTFTIPTTSGVVQCTPIRMRVVTDSPQPSNLNIDSCGELFYGQAEDYLVMIKGSGGNATATISNPPVGGNPSCFNTQLSFSVTGTTGGTPIYYQWYKKNGTTVTAGPIGSTWTANTFQNLDTVWTQMFFAGGCGLDSVVSNKVTVYRVASVAPGVTIGVAAGGNPSCIDDSVSIAVTANVNPGGAPLYYWYVNGVKTLFTGTTFVATGMAAGTQIKCVMKSSAGSCANPDSGISNTIVITHTTKAPIVSIALTTGTNPGCAGQTLTFTAIPTTGGTAPTYQWFKNAVLVPGATGVTYSGVFANNDAITCRMVSNSACALPTTVLSTPITVIESKITADIQISQVSGTNPSCSGHEAIFAANTTNAGSNAQYQWLLNGNPISLANNPIYSTKTLNDQDELKCVLIATDPCVANPLDTSAGLIMDVITSKVPNVSVAITAGKNPGCLDSLVEFTATPTNVGSLPDVTWLINGFPAATGNVFSSSSLLNGDVIVCRINQTDGQCYLPDTAYSVPYTMVRSTTPNPPFIHLVGNALTTNQPGNYLWFFGPNSQQLTQGTNGTLLPTQLGTYYAVSNNNGCWSRPSNVLNITLLDVTTINYMDMLKVYPNPTTGQVTLDWGTQSVNMSIEVYNPVGQRLMQDEMRGQSHKTLNLSNLASGIYYILVKDEEGKTGTIKVTLSK